MSDIPRIRLVTPSEISTPSDTVEGVSGVMVGEKPTDEQVIETLVAQKGRPERAAATLGVSVEYILKVACRNVRTFSQMARTRVMLGSFTTLMKLDEAIQGDVDNMPSDVLGRTYVGAFAAFTQLSSSFDADTSEEEDDDATAAKDDMLERLGKMGKREAAAQAMQETEAAG